MKNKFLVLAVFTLLFISCSDEDNNTKTPVDYTGKWTSTQYLIEEDYDLNQDGTTSNDYMVELPCLTSTIDLKSDNTGVYGSNSYSTDPDDAEKIICIEYEEFNVTWELSSDETEIILSVGGESLNLKIADENTIERYSNSLLDAEIGIPGKIVFTRD